MGRDADLMDNGGDQGFQTLTAGGCLQTAHPQQTDALGDAVHAAGFGHKEVRPQGGRLIDHIAPGKAGDHQDCGPASGQFANLPQQLQPINAAQHQIHHQDVGPTAAHQFQCLLAVAHRANDFHIGFSVDHVCQQDAEFFVRVRK